jgi:Ca2+-binding RTX toxin-like protein
MTKKSQFTEFDDNVTLGKKGEVAHALGGNDTVNGGIGDDTIYGDDGNDTITPGAGNDLVYGGEGNDIIIDGLGNDNLFGDAGDDVFLAGVGTNLYNGGLGVDTVDFTPFLSTSQPLYINLQSSYAVDAPGFNIGITPQLGNGENFNDTLIGVENVSGSLVVPNFLIGSNDANTLIGGDHNDWIEGGAGGDVIRAGAGNDIVRSGPGVDIVFGGAGTDTFVFYESDHSAPFEIKDYSSDEADTLYFVGAAGISGLTSNVDPGGGGTFFEWDITWDSGNTDHYSLLSVDNGISIVASDFPPFYDLA